MQMLEVEEERPILTWGTLTCDPHARQVRYGERLLILTPKEYAILELLLRETRSPLSSRAILERVWAADEFAAQEVVRGHIKELRHKFVAVGAPKDLIKTWHRVGYQLNPAYANPVIAGTSTLNDELAAVRAQLAATQAELEHRNRELKRDRGDRQWQSMVANLPGMVYQYALHADGTEAITYVSPKCRDIYELEPEELLLDFSRARSMIHPDDADTVERINRDSARKLERFESEFRLVMPSGKVKWVRAVSAPQQQANGSIIWDGFVLDISQRKQVEAERERSELLLKQQLIQDYLLADIAQDICHTLDLKEILARTVQHVREFLKTDRVAIFHFRPDWQGDVIAESVGTGWLPIIGSNILDPCFRDTYIEPYRQGRMSAIEDIDSVEMVPCYRNLLASFQVKANLVVPILQQEQLWGLLIAHHCAEPRQWQPQEIDLLKQLATQVGIASQQSQLFRDLQTELAERKRAEKLIQEQAALLDIATDAIFVRDLEHRILYWNQGAERVYGWSATEALGQKANELLHEKPAKIAAITQATVELGEWHGEIEKVTKAGAEVIVEGRWTLVRDEAGQPKSILCVNTDITAKKSLESQFYHAQRLESLGTLASGIAHDLNNVLTPVLAFAQILRTQPGMDEKTQERLQIIEDSARRGADLVKQILTFTRGTIGKRIPLQVAHLLRDVVKVTQQTFPKSIAIERHLPDHLWLVAGDATQLHQVFLNLCVNARDAMPHGGTLRITAENQAIDEMFARLNFNVRAGNYVLVTITDTGVGIPPEILDRIFDPFFTTKPIGEGTGLGLASVLGIVTNHDGFVRVTSTVGQGTEFKIYLPVATEGEATEHRSASPLPNGKGEVILIVDDDPAVREVNRTLLEEHNYRTLIASDGIEAITLYAQQMQTIDLVLIDAMMPHVSGVTTIRTIQRMNPLVKIVAISGLSSNEQPLLEAGAKVFISKPYQLAELLRTISELLNSG